jgi:hypothetical protein
VNVWRNADEASVRARQRKLPAVYHYNVLHDESTNAAYVSITMGCDVDESPNGWTYSQIAVGECRIGVNQPLGDTSVQNSVAEDRNDPVRVW